MANFFIYDYNLNIFKIARFYGLRLKLDINCGPSDSPTARCLYCIVKIKIKPSTCDQTGEESLRKSIQYPTNKPVSPRRVCFFVNPRILSKQYYRGRSTRNPSKPFNEFRSFNDEQVVDSQVTERSVLVKKNRPLYPQSVRHGATQHPPQRQRATWQPLLAGNRLFSVNQHVLQLLVVQSFRTGCRRIGRCSYPG